jgi:hypothetical protein
VNPLQSHTSDADEPVAAIVPEPDEPVRAAILRALAASSPPPAPPGWAAAALREGVEPDEDA